MAGGTLSRIRNMRMGRHSCMNVTLGSGDDSVMVAVVLLPSDIMLDINEAVEERYAPTILNDGTVVKNNKQNDITRSQYYNQLLCFHCMREIDNTDEKIFSSVDEVGSILTLEDIKRVCEAYNSIIINNSNKLETLKQEDFEELKKHLEVTSLKDLSIVSQVHLMYFLQTIRSETLPTNN